MQRDWVIAACLPAYVLGLFVPDGCTCSGKRNKGASMVADRAIRWLWPVSQWRHWFLESAYKISESLGSAEIHEVSNSSLLQQHSQDTTNEATLECPERLGLLHAKSTCIERFSLPISALPLALSTVPRPCLSSPTWLGLRRTALLLNTAP